MPQTLEYGIREDREQGLLTRHLTSLCYQGTQSEPLTCGTNEIKQKQTQIQRKTDSHQMGGHWEMGEKSERDYTSTN